MVLLKEERSFHVCFVHLCALVVGSTTIRLLIDFVFILRMGLLRRAWRTGLPSVLAPRIGGKAVGCGRMGLGLERTWSVWYFHAARRH